jgi:hypothetical protein
MHDRMLMSDPVHREAGERDRLHVLEQELGELRRRLDGLAETVQKIEEDLRRSYEDPAAPGPRA